MSVLELGIYLKFCGERYFEVCMQDGNHDRTKREIERQWTRIEKRIEEVNRCKEEGGHIYVTNASEEKVTFILKSWVDADGNEKHRTLRWKNKPPGYYKRLGGPDNTRLIVREMKKYSLETEDGSWNFEPNATFALYLRDNHVIEITNDSIKKETSPERENTGRVNVENRSNYDVRLSIADFYLDGEGDQVASNAYWRIEPGEDVYLDMDGKHFLASEVRYRLTTAGGSTPRYNKYWSKKLDGGSIDITITPDKIIATPASSSLSSKSKSSPPPRPSPPPASSLPGAYVQSKNARVYENSSGLWYIVLSAQIKIRRSGTYKVRGGFVDRSGDFMRNVVFGTRHVDRTIRGDAGDTISVTMELPQRPGGTWSVEIVDD